MQSFEIITKLSLKNTSYQSWSSSKMFYQHQHGEVIICVHANGGFGLDPVLLWMLDQLISCSFVLFEQLEAKPVAKLSPWATLACSVSLQGVSFELSTPVVPGGWSRWGSGSAGCLPAMLLLDDYHGDEGYRVQFSAYAYNSFFNVSFALRHQYPECFK